MPKTIVKKSQIFSEQNNLKIDLANINREPVFLTLAHKKNYDKAMESRRALNIKEINWKKEVERQKINARND